jgi:hypothetical protein
MDITLFDLTKLEPRLSWSPQSPDGTLGAAEQLTKEVSWAVTARATPPHLPALRAGELLLIPPRVSTEIGDELPALIGQAAAKDVSGLVIAASDPALERTKSSSESIPTFRWRGELGEDTESSINRLLTECRGTMFRVGTELERTLNELHSRRTSLTETLVSIREISGIRLAVLDVRQREIGNSGAVADDRTVEPGDARVLARDLALGSRVVLGPLSPREHVLARFLVDRIVIAVEASLRHDVQTRPRGAGKAEAIRALMEGSDTSHGERRRVAIALGLDPDGVHVVAVTAACREQELIQAFASIGSVHPAGEVGGDSLWLIAELGCANPDQIAARLEHLKHAWRRAQREPPRTLALSAPAAGTAALPLATEEAKFVAALQRNGKLLRSAASFDSLEDLGALKLLYRLRQTPELRQFVDQVLASVASRETLRDTLAVFLESGGSQVEAARRLGIHRNTLSYRLQRIAGMVGVDIADPGTWLTLHLALTASDLLRLTGAENSPCPSSRV